jgi:hypothetical protein
MKTSDKVLIGLLTMIFLTVTAVFVDIKRVIPILEQKFELENFTNLKFVNTVRGQRTPTLEVFRADSSYLRFVVFRDTINYPFSHGISRDTLEINSSTVMEYMHKLELYIANDLNSISLVGTNLHINGINQDKIVADLEDAEIYSGSHKHIATSSFRSIKAKLKNSKLRLYSTTVDTLRVEMWGSRARIDKSIDRVEADLQMNSTLSVKNLSDIQLQKDSSSELEVF